MSISILIKTHSYTLNLATINYMSAAKHGVMKGMCVFAMTCGRKVICTCPYDEVMKQIANFTLNQFTESRVPIKILELQY